jgi:hypothetical protein
MTTTFATIAARIAEIAEAHDIDIEPIVDTATASRAADMLAQSPSQFAHGAASAERERASQSARRLVFGDLDAAQAKLDERDEEPAQAVRLFAKGGKYAAK